MNLSKEIKIFAGLFALIGWISFIRDFQSFWLVHCDIGRGIIDIFGSLCACGIVLKFSYYFCRKSSLISGKIAYFGRYSLLVLCIHIVELDLLPWWNLVEKLNEYGFPSAYNLFFIICGKLALDLGGAVLVSKIRRVRILFGYEC